MPNDQAPHQGPDILDVRELTHLLDVMANYASNEQRARYLLSSNWLRDRGVIAARRIADAAPYELAVERAGVDQPPWPYHNA